MMWLLKIPFVGERLALAFLLIMIATVARGDPDNFMVEGFTFVRPPAWKWVWDEKLARIGRFLEVQGSNTNDSAIVYFRKCPRQEGTPKNRIKEWRKLFKESDDEPKVQTKTKTVAAFPVVYIEMEGISVHKPCPEFALIAASIKMKEGQVVVRMSGHKKLVDDCKTLFRQMVERALKERESD